MNRKILLIIILSQFAGTSLWFAGNAVIGDLQHIFNFENYAIGHVTSAIQFGFVAGTFVFALLTLADRFSPSRIFFICSILAAAANAAILIPGGNMLSLLSLRALTGFLLAGIYPVGMKISADHFGKDLGKALGFLHAALVIGTAFPHLIRSAIGSLPWNYVILTTSFCALAGGILMLVFVPDGPHRKKSSGLQLKTFFRVFGEKSLRASAFGYFGHMWELYTFWAFIPVILSYYMIAHPQVEINIPLMAFLIIASGGIANVMGGYLSGRIGSAKVAFASLMISGICCLLSPALFEISLIPFFIILFLWGLSVTPDSPQFSTMVAHFSPKESTGTALTIMNSIGFAITVISIQAVNLLAEIIDKKYLFLFLAPGPILGLLSMFRLVKIPDKGGKG